MRVECLREEYESEGDMTREQAIDLLDNLIGMIDDNQENDYDTAFKMAIQALEEISHLVNRPCEACEFHGENGCCKWECVFKGV